ncbi:DUF2827 domain-containing protein [Paraburkholderia sp. MMS20-SJTR3]|uniref:DUF2827 domain-containing protein n=1 Tax=Paraburkholderia sejongensis TaxID=2886946 RepID=A0ABS8JM79_9BURK|nr:DUF2827 domain-containing protein [Paraburkholderia sp. MMS20-SJTR3]MCC8391009.1 DUF2827 domain-containing protein [Paraburkholderia sp. MMS20-SJTR3]
MSGLRIGITIGLHHEAETLWNNGIKQNAAFLAEALRHCPQVAGVVLVNTTQVPITPALPWDQTRYPTQTFDAAKDNVDVLIELGGQIDALQTAYLKHRGVRLVSYCCGFEYVHAMESVLFSKPTWGANLFVNQRYDDIWIIPQVENISRSYFEVLRRQSARVVPFVWSPIFLDARVANLPNAGEYQPREGAKRLSVMEPNINVVKFCLYPAFIAELAYRQRPDRIAILQVTNADGIARNSAEFIALMNQLDIVRDQKAVFLGRHETPAFLASNTDIVVSHQLENPLNYFYLEVCWQGYPLVHNAHLCAELGYYYKNNEVNEGARRLLEAIETHDAQASHYRQRQRAQIARYLPGNSQLVATYDALLSELMARPVR